MKAYKVFNPDWTCRGFQYEIGKTYVHNGDISICQAGFHACKKLVDCFNFYPFDPRNKVAEVELLGKIIEDDYKNKIVTDKIKIVKELSWEEVLDMINTGRGNTGVANSGNGNSGNGNSGNGNSGNRNSGNWNIGNRNSGNFNSGDWNSGNRNSGNCNSGDWNSGDWNSGDWNSGSRNSGNWNSGSLNAGFFNSITPKKILVFNKICDLDVWEQAKKPEFIYNVCLTQWINFSDMSDEEKLLYTEAEARGGYLKTLSYKDAWREVYSKAPKEDIELLKQLPNFDADVFEEITGIRIK